MDPMYLFSALFFISLAGTVPLIFSGREKQGVHVAHTEIEAPATQF